MFQTISLATFILFCSTCGEETTGKKETAYTISNGDTLFRIAQHFYGEGRMWPSISRANPSINPQKLVPGKVITIPSPMIKIIPQQQASISHATYQENKTARPAPVSFKTYTITISRETNLLITVFFYTLFGFLVFLLIQTSLFYLSGRFFQLPSISIRSLFKATFLTETTYLFLAGGVFALTFIIVNMLLGKTGLTFFENLEHFWFTLKNLPFQLPILFGILFLHACIGLHYLRFGCNLKFFQAGLIVLTASVLPAIGLTAILWPSLFSV